MTGIEQGALIGGFMLLLLALRVHIGVAMLVAGSIGYIWRVDLDTLLNYYKTVAYARYSVYDLSVVPLFLLMGQFATHGGLSKALFKAGNAMIGHWRGGMAMAAVDGLRRFRCDLRLVARHRRDDGAGRAARTAPPPLLGAAGDRVDRRRRHARHPDPAVGARW